MILLSISAVMLSSVLSTGTSGTRVDILPILIEAQAEGEGEGEIQNEQVALCDFWPMAVGNSWRWTADMVDAAYVESAIIGEFYVNGFRVWTWQSVMDTIAGPRTSLYFQVFVDGWLYGTKSLADLSNLPDITGQMSHFFPEVFTIGEPYSPDDSGVLITPTLVDEDTLVLSTTNGPLYTFSRGVGPQISGFYELESSTIKGGCDDSALDCFAAPAETSSKNAGQTADLGIMAVAIMAFVVPSKKKASRHP